MGETPEGLSRSSSALRATPSADERPALRTTTSAEERRVAFIDCPSDEQISMVRKESDLSSKGRVDLQERRKSQAVELAAAATRERLQSHSSELEEDLRAPSSRDLRVYFHAICDKFKKGSEVIKIASNGNPYKRKIHVNAKPEYFEISSNKLFDIGHHFLDISGIIMDDKSRAFRRFRARPNADRRRIPPSCCCTVRCSSGRNVSIVFRLEAERNEFVYILRVSRSVVIERYLHNSTSDTSRALAKKLSTSNRDRDAESVSDE